MQLCVYSGAVETEIFCHSVWQQFVKKLCVSNSSFDDLMVVTEDCGFLGYGPGYVMW
jgi:hypothetical protein